MIILSVLSIAVLAVLFFMTGNKDGKTSHQVKGAAAVKTENSECFQFDPETLTYDGEGDLDLLEGVMFTDPTDPDAAGESSESGSGKRLEPLSRFSFFCNPMLQNASSVLPP